MNLQYSRYADLPADRDLERALAERLALPARDAASLDRPSPHTWLRRHLRAHRG